MKRRREILSIEPDVTKGPPGWLAVSKEGSPLRIAVAGATKAEAERRFQDELKAWAALSDQPRRGKAG